MKGVLFDFPYVKGTVSFFHILQDPKLIDEAADSLSV